MNYEEVLRQMFSSLPMYQREGKAAYKANLDNTWALAELTNHPHNHFKSIHIAGTNGKGSTAHMLSSIFQEAGYKTGLYTSPHLEDFRERIKINGKMIPETEVVDFYSTYSTEWKEIQPSFFEMTVLMAFNYFKNQQVDIAIIETGLGGRLDSTNIINPEVSVITNIGLDHTQFLGNTIEKIAGEKAGIIKEKTPVVVGNLVADAQSVISGVATQNKAPFHASQEISSELKTDLKGEFQNENLKTVLKTIEVVQSQKRFYIQQPHIDAGLMNVKSNSGLKGRFDTIAENPTIIADGAHNPAGIKTLIKELENEMYNKLHIVWSMVSDKDVKEVLKLLPENANYYFCESSVPRSMKIEDLKRYSGGFSFHSTFHKSVKNALNSARDSADSEDLILVTGSFFTVADALISLKL